MSGSRKSYTIGYGRPPVATRFRPGQSGNPRGRPKGSRSVGDVLEATLNRRVQITENGRARKMPAIEIVLLKLIQDAMRGNTAAIRLLLALTERYGEKDGPGVDAGALSREDRAILAMYAGALRDGGESSPEQEGPAPEASVAQEAGPEAQEDPDHDP
jgi:hypothetical protein